VKAALRVRALPWHHRDPFDRLLIAQAADEYFIATRDQIFSKYNISILPI
jgi:PIN domain nuclease of toxin-antitoxin system